MWREIASSSWHRKATGMIRPTKPEDTEALVKLAAGTNVFKPH